MSAGNPDGGNPGTSNEIVEEQEQESALAALHRRVLMDDQLRKSFKEDLQKLRDGGTKEETLSDRLNKEKVHPPYVHDVITGTMFYQSKYLGSSFEGMITVCTGRMQLIDELDAPDLTVVKSVPLQEPPSPAHNDLRERVRISGRVRDHPNILRVERALNYANKYFVIFKNVSCDDRKYHMESLRSVMEKHYPMGMPLTLTVVCLREALRGLSAIHRAGEVHKEISAGQIFLGRGNVVKLAFSATIYEFDTYEDQTAAAAAASSSSASSFPMSKVCRWASAPEVYQNEAAVYDRRSDIWLIGITAFELAYGPGGFVRDRSHLEDILEDIHREGKLPKRPAAAVKKIKKKEKAVKALQCLVPACVRPDKAQTTEREVWEDFQAMVMKCLQRDANSRPTVQELMNSKVFVDEEKDADYIFQCLSDIGASRAT